MLTFFLDVIQDVVYENDYFAIPRIQSLEYDTEQARVDLCITPQSGITRGKGLQLSLLEKILTSQKLLYFILIFFLFLYPCILLQL